MKNRIPGNESWTALDADSAIRRRAYAVLTALLLAVVAQVSLAQIAPAPKLLVLGDSLSAAHNIPREAGWVNLLREKVHQQWPQARVINASVSGATTAAGLQRLPQLLEQHQPDVVILELGANDGLQGKPIPHITANLTRLIESSQAAGADVVLLGVHLPPNYGAGYTKPFFEQYRLLAEQYTLAYVPFILEGVAGNNELMQEDRLHPTAEAQPRVLDNLWPTVERAVKGVVRERANQLENPGQQEPDNQEKGEEGQ